MARPRALHTLLLVRCGESLWETEGRLHGHTDLPLSDPGRSLLLVEAARLRWMNGGTVYHPPDEAATETARVLAERFEAKARAIKDLADPDLGLLDGLSLAEFEERFAKRFKQWEDDPIHLAPPEGEELVVARDRILAAVHGIFARPRTRDFAMVLHPLALSFVRAALGRRPAGTVWRMLEGRPRFERYILTADAAERLDAMRAAPSG
jgi:broad specificity phosphatase PhoE